MAHYVALPAQHMDYLNAQHRIPFSAAVALRVAVVLSQWAMRRRTRLALHQLSDHQLRDVGLTYPEAYRECRKWFWRS